MNGIKRTLIGAVLLTFAASSQATIIFETGFEPPEYAVGDVDGQAGWSTPTGATDRVRIRDDVPREGQNSLWAASGGGVAGTGAFRDLSADLTNSVLTITSRVIFTTGIRSDWEFNTAIGSAGFLGGVRVNSAGNWVLATALGEVDTGIAISGFSMISLILDFTTGTASAMYSGVEIASGLAFDTSNSQLTQVAAVNLLTPRADAIALDAFSVDATRVPTPPSELLLGLGLLGVALAQRKRRALGRRAAVQA